MELRRLQASDLFSMVRILNKVGFNNVKDAINLDEIKNLKSTMTDENAKSVTSEIGINVVTSVVGVLLEHLPNVETDLYNFVGSVANMKANAVAKMDIGEFMDLLIEIVKKEEFKDFFNRASKLIK